MIFVAGKRYYIQKYKKNTPRETLNLTCEDVGAVEG